MADGTAAKHGISPVAVDRNWQHRVHNELESSKHWADKWGFMAGDSAEKDSIDSFMTTSKGCTSTLSLNLANRKQVDNRDSVDGFLHQYMMKAVGPAMRAYPKQEFKKPTLSSHAVGWGKNLERFGPLQLRMR